jgi:NAD+ synthase (glutamine-hydrolysing)
MNIAIFQFNPKVGDLSFNVSQIIKAAQQAQHQGADLLLTPELSLCGYPPQDLLLESQFSHQIQYALDQLLELEGITVLVGHPWYSGNECFNRVSVIRDGHLIAHHDKLNLPNYKVFDECRYFIPGASVCVFEQKGVRIGVVICEDLWDTEPVAETIQAGAELILAPNASPYYREKWRDRHQTVRYRCEENACPIIYAHYAGAQDELVFDGGSFAMNRQAQLVWQAPQFKEDLSLLNYSHGDLQASSCAPHLCIEEECYRALCLGLRDYVHKNGFQNVLLGLSGGIDSALVLAIASDALGPEHVHAIMLPSPYTSEMSLQDAQSIAQAFGVRYDVCPIWPTYEVLYQSIKPLLGTGSTDTTEENLQARIRANILMAIANKTGSLLLTTGNKSEVAVGYATLYGDMAGAFAVIKDLTKTWVYRLSRWHIKHHGAKIPQRIIERAPSAELRPDQTDQDSLPPYDLLDSIIEAYVEHHQGSEALIAQGFCADTVHRVLSMIRRNEYKRQQSAIGTRVTDRSFGRDWRYPLTQGFFS